VLQGAISVSHSSQHSKLLQGGFVKPARHPDWVAVQKRGFAEGSRVSHASN